AVRHDITVVPEAAIRDRRSGRRRKGAVVATAGGDAGGGDLDRETTAAVGAVAGRLVGAGAVAGALGNGPAAAGAEPGVGDKAERQGSGLRGPCPRHRWACAGRRASAGPRRATARAWSGSCRR